MLSYRPTEHYYEKFRPWARQPVKLNLKAHQLVESEVKLRVKPMEIVVARATQVRHLLLGAIVAES